MILRYIISFIIIVNFLCCDSNVHIDSPSGLNYITGEDGVIRMHINIIGHVKNPGTYLVYDGIDFLSALSASGGYLTGTNLNKILIYGKDGSKNSFSLSELLNNESSLDFKLKLKPFDTIYIQQKTLSRVFNTSNVPSLIISIMNLAITLERNSD